MHTTRIPVQKHTITLQAAADHHPNDTIRIEVRPIWGSGGTRPTGRYVVRTYFRCGWEHSAPEMDWHYCTDNLPDFDTAMVVAHETARAIRAEGRGR